MMVNKEIFVERLRQLLNDAELPYSDDARAEAFGKIFDINPLVAERIIDGLSEPSEELLTDIADEFEVQPKWLTGDDDSGKNIH